MRGKKSRKNIPKRVWGILNLDEGNNTQDVD